MEFNKVIKNLKLFLVTVFLSGMMLFSPMAVRAEQATSIPWSGYWWPYIYGALATGTYYRGHPAPLEKYYQLTEGVANGPAVNEYKKVYYDPSALPWNGLCPSWARAAMMENYEIFPSSEDNIVFRVGDKKGLLTLCHDGDLTITGDASDPVNFHMWLLQYIKDEKVPFTADLDPGIEVWYYPIYRYDMSTQKTGLTQSVTVTIYYASDNVKPDYIGIFEKQKAYTYNLMLDNSGDIIGGEWTGNSIADHPATMIYPLSSAQKNVPSLDSSKVREIAKTKDDFLESPDNSAVNINPGTYHLVLLNLDQYLLSGTSGDQIYFGIDKDDSSAENLQIALTDANGEPVMNQTLKSWGSMTYEFKIDSPPYTLSITQNNYNDPNIYTLTFDVQKGFQQHVPYIAKQGQWNGYSITNAGNEKVDNVMLITGMSDGKPLQTVLGPIDLNPGEKKVVFFDDLPWRKHEYAVTDSIRLVADEAVSFVNLFALDDKPMAGFMEEKSTGTHLVIPDTYEALSIARRMTGGVLNESFSDAPVTFKVFSADGDLKSQISQTIPAGGKLAIQPGNSPFNNVANGGWIDIVATSGNQLAAYQYITDTSGKKDSIDVLFAPPIGVKTKIVPHITWNMQWWRTYLTLINDSGEINDVNFHLAKAGNDHSGDKNIELAPHEKTIIDLSDEFGKVAGEALYHSVLEITGTYAIAGYYKYSSPYGGDEAGYPLLDHNVFRKELILPHQTGDSNKFWTGVGICNPNVDPVKVTMKPYDDNGEIISSEVKTLNLDAGAYDVFTVGQEFSEDASDISFIKFQSGGDPIGGFYLFGNMRNNLRRIEMLSGANM